MCARQAGIFDTNTRFSKRLTASLAKEKEDFFEQNHVFASPSGHCFPCNHCSIWSVWLNSLKLARFVLTSRYRQEHHKYWLIFSESSYKDLAGSRSVETFYLICAGGGGALVICQFLASLFGLSGGHDVDTDHDVDSAAHAESDTHHDQPNNSFLGLLTFRSIAAAITFFGLGGLTSRYYESTEGKAFATALVAAVAALYLVGTLMKTMYKLKADGTVRIERAVGQVGRVYLPIPGKKAGSGKVTFSLQNRTVECLAMTAADDIATGSTVTVVAVLGPNLVEVSPLPAA
jgi:hypothetical protein